MGGPYDGDDTGAAWVFTRSGAEWVQEAKLTGAGASGPALFGISAALSSDGNTALIGGPFDTGDVGAPWVFRRSGATWAQQGQKITGGGTIGTASFGVGVALSADGNTAIVGAPTDASLAGAAWIFTRSGSAWTQQGPKLTGAGEVGTGQFGVSVSLSGGGATALVGAPNDDHLAGAARVFVRTAGVWSRQGDKLVGAGAAGAESFGYDVSLSGNGDTAVIGGSDDGQHAGAAWVVEHGLDPAGRQAHRRQ